jgi:hypothetical protein
MAFQNYDELIQMASKNPKLATNLVRRAQNSSRPVVSADNPGYSDLRQNALKRQMNKSQSEETIEQRKNESY